MTGTIDVGCRIIPDVGINAVHNIARRVTVHANVASKGGGVGVFRGVDENVPGGIDMGVAFRRHAATEANVHDPVVVSEYVWVFTVAPICRELPVIDDEHVRIPRVWDVHLSVAADDVVAAFEDVLAIEDHLNFYVLVLFTLILSESFHEPLDVALLALHNLLPFVRAALAALPIAKVYHTMPSPSTRKTNGLAGVIPASPFSANPNSYRSTVGSPRAVSSSRMRLATAYASTYCLLSYP